MKNLILVSLFAMMSFAATAQSQVRVTTGALSFCRSNKDVACAEAELFAKIEALRQCTQYNSQYDVELYIAGYTQGFKCSGGGIQCEVSQATYTCVK
jgi:hypothetical protein